MSIRTTLTTHRTCLEKFQIGTFPITVITKRNNQIFLKKALRETQTLRAGCSKAEP